MTKLYKEITGDISASLAKLRKEIPDAGVAKSCQSHGECRKNSFLILTPIFSTLFGALSQETHNERNFSPDMSGDPIS